MQQFCNAYSLFGVVWLSTFVAKTSIKHYYEIGRLTED